MKELYIGLMSGTSADGIDLALVDFSTTAPTLIATDYHAYDNDHREHILNICNATVNDIHAAAELDVKLGKQFADVVNTFLKKQNIANTTIRAIGSHGQTVRHHPHGPHPFTLQIGDPNTIAALTGITTVGDFRRKDVAHGGQGAPLVPAFHQQIFSSTSQHRVIANIGGIANITLLPNDTNKSALGFDTGPGNALLDAWIMRHQQQPYDKNGDWARKGTINEALLKSLLHDSYFSAPPPKSTGREYFHLGWLDKHLQQLGADIAPVDVQATLVELTAQSILHAVQNHFYDCELYICGGGAHNKYLMKRLNTLGHPHIQTATTEDLGIAPDWIEAMAFAWLARQTLAKKPGNLPAVTGATKSAILGAIYYA